MCATIHHVTCKGLSSKLMDQEEADSNKADIQLLSQRSVSYP